MSTASSQLTAPLSPDWPSDAAIDAVVATLRDRAPLVRPADCLALRERLADVALGRALVIQGGDCAELIAEVSAAGTARKVAQLTDLGALMTAGLGRPVVRIGRLAGQFAKPRSAIVDVAPDGTTVPVYRGDAINGLEPTVAARTPDPRRLLYAYDAAARIHGHLPSGVYTSHEALLHEYERPLVRVDAATGVRYGGTAHLLWAGHRTRGADGAHVGLLARIANPVAVKLGPGATAGDVWALVNRLDPGREPGRLTFIARFGADQVAEQLPALVHAVRLAGATPVWLCDPMHGNTVRTATGRKTRAVRDLVAEVRAFVDVLRSAGAHPGGLHLEMSPEDVTECVSRRHDATGEPDLPRYRTACDPRLNPVQAREVVGAFVAAVGGAVEGSGVAGIRWGAG